MNQILYTKDNYNNKEAKKEINSKSFNVFFIIPIIMIIALLCITLQLYVVGDAEEVNTEVTNTNQNIIDMPLPINNSELTEKVQTNIVENVIETSNAEETKEEIKKASNNNEKVQTNTKIATKYKGYDVIATLNIPSLKINYPVLSKTSDKLLNVSLNKYWGANPNEVGNMVVVGHNFNDGKFFSALPKIKKGAIIKVTDLTGKTLEYKVYKTDVIDPYDNSCTSQLTDGHTEITLITCYNHGKQRFIAKARAD